MKAEDSEGLLRELLGADTEEAVLRILNGAQIWDDPACWETLGGQGFDTNAGVVQSQQGLSSAALTEKLINAIDAVLLRAAAENGIDPRDSASAPSNMREAVERLFGVKNGDLGNLTARERTALAEQCVALVATGSQKQLCLSVIDRGEGQSPDQFRETFLRLCGGYKQDITFVQGRFGMGGTGVIPNCGERGLQLIVSRRHPQMLREGDSPAWGWTLIRRCLPTERKPSLYQFLALDGQIPRVQCEELELWPDENCAFAQPLRHGTVAKLFEYRLEKRELHAKITMDLAYQLGRRLVDPPLPIRIYERRPDYMKGHSHETTFSGMKTRLLGLEAVDADGRTRLEDGFPSRGMLNYRGKYPVPVWLAVLSRSEGRARDRARERFSSATQAVLLTINGQTHATYGRQFFATGDLKYDYIKNDLLVVVDCTSLPIELQEDIFMSSRDRPREGERTAELKADLEKWLHDHEGLRSLNDSRRLESTKQKVAHDKTLTEVFTRMVGSSPALRSLFGVGRDVKLPGTRRNDYQPVSFHGVRYPTYFRFQGAEIGVDTFNKSCPENSYCRVVLLTDAENAYFSRIEDPGTIDIHPFDALRSYTLWNGKLTVSLSPAKSRAGERYRVNIQVTDSSRIEPFARVVELEVIAPVAKSSHDKGSGRRQQDGIAVPEPCLVYRDKWEEHGFDALSAVDLRHQGNGGGYDVYLNMDNAWLIDARDRATSEAAKLLVDRRYQVGMTLLSFGALASIERAEDGGPRLQTESGEEMSTGDVVGLMMRGLAQVVLPLLDGLKALDERPAAGE